jgi:hypothetical protein
MDGQVALVSGDATQYNHGCGFDDILYNALNYFFSSEKRVKPAIGR